MSDTFQDEPDHRLSKPRIRQGFARIADAYDAAAVLEREVGLRMMERLELVRLDPDLVADLGCGTGAMLPGLLKRYPQARILAMDLVPGMVARAARRRHWLRRPLPVCADIENLPLGSGSCDLVFCNLVLFWCDLERALGEIRRVLKPNGLFMFSTLGPDTLIELRRCWGEVDSYTHINAFLDMHDVGDALVRNGFAEPVMDTERFTLTYRHFSDLLRDVRHTGAGNAAAGRCQGLTGGGRLRALEASYERHRHQGLLSATAEVVHGHAWGPTRQSLAVARDGEVTIPVTAIHRRSR